MRAFIHTVGSVPFNEECASAQRGFEQLGIEVVPFSSNDVLEKATRNDVVVGGMFVCEHALSLLGIAIPSVEYPYAAREYLGREVEQRSVGSIRQHELPLFVKPVAEKELPGAVITSLDDLRPYLNMGELYELWVSKPVSFVSEWRVFVRWRRIIGAHHYRGDSRIEPDWLVAGRVVDRSYGAPGGYAIDLGVTNDGRTLIVELNDGFSLGSYGLEDVSYALLLAARWMQLTGANDPLHAIEAPPAQGPVANALNNQAWTDYSYRKPGRSIPPSEPDLPRWVWGIAGNVRDYTRGMEDKQQKRGKRKGTKHFAPGTLVWVMHAGWDPDDRMPVVGKKRGTHRYIRKVMDINNLENFRAKRIFSPTVISWMDGARADLPNSGESWRYSDNVYGHGSGFFTVWTKDEAEALAEFWNNGGASGL